MVYVSCSQDEVEKSFAKTVLIRASVQSCPALCDPMDCSLPGSSVHGILPARISNWVPFPGDLHDPGIEPRSPALQAASLPADLPGKPQA